MNRPVAARAALQLAVHCQPSNDELRQTFQHLFGEASHLPATARREFRYAGLPVGVDAQRRQAWDRALSSAATGKLSDAAMAFSELTHQDPTDAAAWYNLALSRAWLGDNRAAIEALEQYVTLEPDETAAGAAWTLSEILRCGMGMEDEASYVEHSVVYQIRDPGPVSELLKSWDAERRLIVTQTGEQQGFMAALVLDAGTGLAGTPTMLRGIGAYLMIIVDHLRLGHVNVDALAKTQQELEQRLGPALGAARRDKRPASYNEILSEALAFPMEVSDQEEAKRRVADHARRFLEEIWPHRPLPTLGMVAPIDAVGHSTLRKKVIGAVQFLQECAHPEAVYRYDFDRLRRKLGLSANGREAAATDIEAMSTAELSGLDAEKLSDSDAEKAYQSALKLDARELAGSFARSLITRPANPGGPDRFPWYSFLASQALADGNTQAAIDIVKEGEKHDSEHNEGRRRNEYELRRGQIHAKRGEATEAEGIFAGLVAREPSDLRLRASAAEALLSARQTGPALRFAEEGLNESRKQNNRDSEQHFIELVSAAKRQQGS
jgi:tetratricopeptide (TPR) repeat protein